MAERVIERKGRSREAIRKARADRGGIWPLVRKIRRHRPLLTAAVVIAALAHALRDGEPPVNLLEPRASVLFVLPWTLLFLGVAIRIWGSGNLRKNSEFVRTGAYRLVRHPLYFGSLAIFLAFFLAMGNPWVGLGLFLVLVGLVYYPTMLAEEEYLFLRFPEEAERADLPPRLVLNLLRFPEAIRSDRFSLEAARYNLGLRTAWALPLLPAALWALGWVEARL